MMGYLCRDSDWNIRILHKKLPTIVVEIVIDVCFVTINDVYCNNNVHKKLYVLYMIWLCRICRSIKLSWERRKRDSIAICTYRCHFWYYNGSSEM